MIKLRAGDHVAIVAPSAQIGDESKIKKGIDYLKSLGLIPVYGKHLFLQNRYMAGSDIQRAEDVNDAFADPDIKAIFCVRAAAGATRILPYIDYKLAKQNPKPVIGFCDNIALQIALNKLSDTICINGFLLTYDFKNSSLDNTIRNDLEKLLSGQSLSIQSGMTLRSGSTSGSLIATNLSVLMRMAGTPYFPNLANKILIIEDVHERFHKIDLMLQQLKQQPEFSKLKAVIFGQFSNCDGDEEDGTLMDIFNDFLDGTDIPSVYDFNFGHTPSRRVLPVGAHAELSADECLLQIRLD